MYHSNRDEQPLVSLFGELSLFFASFFFFLPVVLIVITSVEPRRMATATAATAFHFYRRAPIDESEQMTGNDTFVRFLEQLRGTTNSLKRQQHHAV